MSETATTAPPVVAPLPSLSEHLFEQFSVLLNADVSAEQKIQHLQQNLHPHVQEPTDAYITLSGNVHQCHLPVLSTWNSTFRKAYTILFWIRPRLEQQKQQETLSGPSDLAPATTNLNDASERSETQRENSDYCKRVLYRFSTAPEDNQGTGVCVTCSQWKVVAGQEELSPSAASPATTEDAPTRRHRKLQTTLTAFALPYNNPDKLLQKASSGFLRGNSGSGATPYSSWTQQVLTLTENTWQLVGFTHVYPYLKRPVWTVVVDGLIAQTPTELHYPVLSESSSSKHRHHLRTMDYCTVLQNVTAGGALVMDVTDTALLDQSTNSKSDDQKTASQLAAEAAAWVSGPLTVLDMQLDVAAVSLYAEAISHVVQAVLCEAGPVTAQQKYGRILTTLPPVANWTKGCSLQGGPKVGVPLTVHGTALEIQQLSGSVQFATSATSALNLGGSNQGPNVTMTRWSCPFVPMYGKTDATPRLGLIQPEAVATAASALHHGAQPDELPALYVTGNCSVVNALSNYLQQHQPREPRSNNDDDDETVYRNKELTGVTQNWSIAWTEQQAVTFCILPFFLALTPPVVERRQSQLLTASWKHLYSLYGGGGSSQGLFAARLLQFLTALLRTGGARVHEEILQNGILHILASSMRLGLIRAAKLKLFKDTSTATSLEDFLKRAPKLEEQTALASTSSSASVSPSVIPPAIAEAVVELLDLCCGPIARKLDELSPAMQIRRTSDLALTALFGLALDVDVWGGDVVAASIIWQAVAARYGAVSCVTTGYVLRSQVSVQHFIDQIKLLRFDSSGQSESSKKQQALVSVALSLSQLLQSMLLSSLSNHRSIIQAEKDIAACIGSLSDCPLGSVTAHVVLSAIVGVLTWCEILPIEASTIPNMEPGDNEEHKVEVASRLGRNLLMAQFHDVVAPVLLSRTVFSGEKSMVVVPKSTLNLTTLTTTSGPLCWQNHWRQTLLLFSWIASIAGPEGLISSKLTGSLVLASALAGSLEGALDDSDKVVMATLFIPSPAMALLIGATLRNEWSYKDLIADRLQVMVPLLPGMIVSLLSHPSDYSIKAIDSTISTRSLIVLSEILISVGGAFHRVFGGVVHSAGRQSLKTRGEGSSDAIKAARVYVPHLLVVSMILENHIAVRSPMTKSECVSILRVPSTDDYLEIFRKGPDSCVDSVAARSSSSDLVGELALTVPYNEGELDSQDLVSFLRACQKTVMSTACGLISSAMSLGGAGTSLSLWTTVLSTLEESVVYAAFDDSQTTQHNSETKTTENESGLSENNNEHDLANGDQQMWASTLANNVLCRAIALVLLKSLKREQHWDVLGYEVSSAMSKLLVLIEERELLSRPVLAADKGSIFNDDQVVLICSLLDILAYGREASGWCQLTLPSMAFSTDSNNSRPSGDMAANSKLLLPVVRPCLRIMLTCLEYIPGTTKILLPGSNADDEQKTETLLGRVLPELHQTLTAAIVGLTFSSARDTALHAMAAFRKCIAKQKGTGDDASAELCSSLLMKVAEELRVRYESERRLRDTALFDAYEEAGSSHFAREAAQGSLAVERLILGDNGWSESCTSSEEITFNDAGEASPIKASDDFVLFHEPSFGNQETSCKLGFSFLQGLGAALEVCKIPSDLNAGSDGSCAKSISILAPFLDAWDATAVEDAKNTELIKLFETNIQLSAESPSNALRPNQLPILGSETAADAMSTFFEFAAAEKSRLQEVSLRFLPGHRASRKAFSERFCWARYDEVAPSGLDCFWERAIPDGNRDVRSRMPTLPCGPQFRRYLPKYLDNASERSDTALGDNGTSPADLQARTSIATVEMDVFTKTLIETGHLEIVDITKKEIDDEEFTEPQNTPALVDDYETGLFAEIGLEAELPMTPSSEDQDSNEAMGDTNFDADSGSEDFNPTDPVSHDKERPSDFVSDFSGKVHHSITTSSFSTPPDNSSSSLSLMHSAAAGMIERHVDNCTHVKAEGNRQCTMLLTSSHLILEYDGNEDGFYEGEILAMQEDADRQRRMAEDLATSKEKDPEALNQQMDEKRQREMAALRPKSIRWNLSEVSHIYLRR